MKKISLLTASVLFGLTVFSQTTIKYDFSADVAGTAATTPPAANCVIGTSNTATAGVVSFTDINGNTSNYLKTYTNGTGTGVINLSALPASATDYSITWKECLGRTANEYKSGVLLRATSSKGTTYAPGMMEGYYCLVHNFAYGGANSNFRIITSTSTGIVNDANIPLAVSIPATQPMWYRASVSGSSSVLVTLEYSADSVTWTTGATYTDAAGTYKSGATQLVWGLGNANTDFYLDNITYYSSNGVPTAVNNTSMASPVVVSQVYYTLTGEKVSHPINDLRGMYILKQYLSDGTVNSLKVLLK